MKKTNKIIVLIMVFLISFLSTNVFATENWNAGNKKREKLFQETLDGYIAQYMKEDTPDEEKIVKYEYTGMALAEETDDILAVNISFMAEPYYKDSEIWKIKNKNYNQVSFNCFAKYKKVNGDYELERVSGVPEYYDEFLQKYEEYEANKAKGEQENTSIQGKAESVDSGNVVINNISIGLYVTFGIIFMVCFIFIIKILKRN